MHAGELTIYVGKVGDYGHVDASSMLAKWMQDFGDNKGGLFRTVSKDANGQYRLHAHVGSGQLTLR